MSRLFRLREWLTVEEAARHLTIVLGEQISEADVLRLGLDGHLTLSVDFVNHARGYLGCVVPFKDVPIVETPWRFAEKDGAPKALRYPDGLRLYGTGELTEDTPFLCLDRTPVTLRGVWDLAMIGNERSDIEHHFQQITGGPPITLINIEGAFVRRRDQWAQVLDRFGEVEVPSRDGKKRKLENTHFPAASLPADSVLVVRTEALSEFQSKLKETSDEADSGLSKLSTRERDTLLKLVIGMALEAYRHDPGAARSAAPAEIAADLAKHGLSITDDTVRKYLKEASGFVSPKRPTGSGR